LRVAGYPQIQVGSAEIVCYNSPSPKNMELEGKAKDLLAIEANVIEEAVTKLSIVITHLLHFLQYILQAVHKRVRKC
jgi:hypothetical protein